MYLVAIVASQFHYLLASTAWTFGAISAARRIHEQLVNSILGTTLR